jgi:hypothetical protein
MWRQSTMLLTKIIIFQILRSLPFTSYWKKLALSMWKKGTGGGGNGENYERYVELIRKVNH